MRVPAFAIAIGAAASVLLISPSIGNQHGSELQPRASSNAATPISGVRLASLVSGDQLTTSASEVEVVVEVQESKRLPVIRVDHGPEILPTPTLPRNRASRRRDPSVDAAELLSIKFKGYEDISGDYRVNADDTISVPVLGRVSISGQSPAELETKLATKVFQLTGRQSYVTVEVVRYRPVFVTGLVTKADSFPWTRNMTVLQAETLAGGIFRNKQSSIIGSDKQQSIIDRSLVVLKRSLAKLERIMAERENRESLSVPKRLTDLVGEEEAKRLIQNELGILRNRLSALKTKRAALNAARKAAMTEIEGLKGLKETVEKQINRRDKIARKVGRLARRGLITDTRMADIEGKVADFSEKMARIRVSSARAEASLLKIRRELVEINEARRVELDREMVKLEDTIQENEIELNTARRSLTKLNINEGKQLAGTGNAPKIVYEIVRNSGGQMQTFPADRFTPLLAGDVLVVGIEGSAPRQPGALAPGSNAARSVGN